MNRKWILCPTCLQQAMKKTWLPQLTVKQRQNLLDDVPYQCKRARLGARVDIVSMPRETRAAVEEQMFDDGRCEVEHGQTENSSSSRDLLDTESVPTVPDGSRRTETRGRSAASARSPRGDLQDRAKYDPVDRRLTEVWDRVGTHGKGTEILKRRGRKQDMDE